ncbi:unnamed protein product [Allacma fusca]|uniref:Uncharacterized protein n=1 Tax=Allacma fusca TaxID=39272 RepID=A0A8J2LUW0_9HEXA|nr:unnamed protein product [Allacma fusca]
MLLISSLITVAISLGILVRSQVLIVKGVTWDWKPCNVLVVVEERFACEVKCEEEMEVVVECGLRKGGKLVGYSNQMDDWSLSWGKVKAKMLFLTRDLVEPEKRAQEGLKMMERKLE